MGRANRDNDDTKRVSPDDRDKAKRRLADAISEEATLADRRGQAADLAGGPTATPEHEVGIAGKDLEAGERVGEYVIEEVIGRGGFGTVYRAIQPLIGKRVAIKVLSRKYSVDSEIVSRFIAEARAVNQIRHRHIIDIFSFGQLPDGRHYYVMEHLDGEPLDRYLASHGALPLADALPILRAIARALDAAHAKGIAHRDLKPENIYIAKDSDGEVFPKLLDFGIAKLLGPDDQLAHKTGTGVPIGTPLYMSPEQARGRDVDHRTDIYSFGILAYRLLTGAYPFEGDMIEVLHKQIHDEPATPSSLNGTLTPEVDAAIAWMMRKDLEQRPRTVMTGVLALQNEQAPTPLLQASSSGLAAAAATSKMMPQASSTRARWIVAALVVGLAGAIAVGLAIKSSQKAPVAAAPSLQEANKLGAADAAIAVEVVPADAQPVHVIVTVDGVPDGTEVTGPGITGIAPGPVQMPRGSEAVVLTFKAEGYVPVAKSVVPDHEQALTVTLKKKPRAGNTQRDPESLDDPFRKKQ